MGYTLYEKFHEKFDLVRKKEQKNCLLAVVRPGRLFRTREKIVDTDFFNKMFEVQTLVFEKYVTFPLNFQLFCKNVHRMVK